MSQIAKSASRIAQSTVRIHRSAVCRDNAECQKRINDLQARQHSTTPDIDLYFLGKGKFLFAVSVLTTSISFGLSLVKLYNMMTKN